MADKVYEYIGQKIQSFRNQHGMTQEDLARQVEVTPNTISRWETATYKVQIENLESLSRIFRVPIWSFLPSEVQAPTEQLQTLLSATGDLPEEDLIELERYAEFIRARTAIKGIKKRPGRKPKNGPDQVDQQN